MRGEPMTTPRITQDKRAGFALIDIIVALAIAGLIFAAIAALIDLTSRAAQRSADMTTSQADYVLFRRVSTMLESAVFIANPPQGGCGGVTGDAETLSLFTASPPFSFKRGIAETQFVVEPSQGGQALWVRLRPIVYDHRSQPLDWSEAVSRQITNGRSVQIMYRAHARGRPSPATLEWTDSCRPPKSVDVVILGEDGEEKRLSFPIRIQQRANLR